MRVLYTGAVFGEYQLARSLGEGPSGSVWAAARIDRIERVVLKIADPLRFEKDSVGRAFERLARSLAGLGRLSHPNLPAVLGTARRDDGSFALVSQYHDGGNIDGVVPSDPKTLRQILGLFAQLGGVLGWLHDAGVIHTNLKPGNVLVVPGSSGPTVKLLDLCWSNARLALPGGPFQAPEQLSGDASTPATDQWAMARVLQHLVLKANPNAAPAQALATLPVALLKAMKRALDANPKGRFGHVRELTAAFEEVRESLPGGGTIPPTGRPAPTVPVDPLGRPAAGATGLGAALVNISSEGSPTAQTEVAPQRRGPRALSQLGSATQPVAVVTADPDPFEGNLTPGPAEDPTMPPEPRAPSQSASVLVLPPEPSLDAVPVHPHDPTDVLPAVKPARSRRSLGLGLAMLAGAAILVGGITWGLKPEALTTVSEPSTISKPAPEPVVAASPVDPAPPAPVAPPPAAPPPVAPPPAAPPPAAPPPAVAQVVAPPPKTVAPPPKTVAAATEPCPTAADCGALGEALIAQQDRRGALAAFVRACNYRSSKHCLRAADLHVDVGSAKEARRLYEKACDNRDGSACEKLSKLWRDGLGGEANPRTAEAFARRACEFGRSAACP